ncbi:hypothetical protein H4Q26_005409 [Puccinia striiformis f. sp. tritici PST-130]|nr:hypothetical protein H4Q26_005409 [Puccinia striiformis f. sp. tritici PST-130]
MDSSIETRMQLLYHYTHHLIGQRRRGLIVLERAKVLFLAHHLYKYLNQKKPIPKHISILTGAMWLDELIYNPNPVAFHDNLGMSVPAFMKLKDLLEEHRVLYDSKHVTATKKLGILLYMLITGLSNQKLQERFQRSASTISFRFEVINSGCHYDITIQVKVIIVMTFLHNFIRVTDPSEPVNLANTATMVDTDSQQPDTAEYGLLHQPGVTRAESTRAAKKRDEIAIHMWTDYQRILRHRQRHGQGDVFTTSLVV